MSNTDVSSLLRALGSGVRPDASTAQRPSAPVEQQSFTALLAGAVNAQKPSDRPVEFAQGMDVSLNTAQLEQLAQIIDNAEAQGSTRLAVLHEGDVLQIDVLTRTVESVERFDPNRIFTDIDAVANLDEQAEDALPKQLSRTEALARSAAGMFGVRNASLASLLESVAGVIDPDQNEPNEKNHTGAA